MTTFTKRAENVADVISINYYADIDYQVYGVTWYLTNSGELHGCGYNSKGQQGISPETSYIVEGFTKRADSVVQFMCSYLTTWYINKSGELYGCGNQSGGNQGNGSTDYNGVTEFTKRP